jgi:glutamate dehydrogenase
VKASAEDDAEVGDRANDRERVDGKEVRARVVGEGGNLGFTQRGRLEYWARGGLVNTDAVDNSGGVDMSDHEVNLKILMNLLVKKGAVKGKEERNRILMEMTEEVAALVLADNANQARALTLDGMRSAARYEEFVSLIEDMLGAGVLNRVDDAIPTQAELLASPERKRGLPRPLLAVLLGHTKMWAFEMAMESEFPDSPAGRPFLEAYFPKPIRDGFAAHLGEHTLRREIVATAAVNHLINNAGITFLSRVMAAADAGIGEVMTAYFDAEREAGAAAARPKALESGQAAEAQHQALLDIEQALEAAAVSRLKGKPVGSSNRVEATRVQP